MKKRLFTKNRLIALLITLVAALFLGAVYIFCSPLNSSSDVFTKRTPVASSLANSSAMESFDVKYLLKDADGKTKTDIWQEVTEDAKNAGKIIYVELGEDWCLDDAGQPQRHLDIPAGRNITLNLNGYTISRNLSGPALNGALVVVEGDFTLTDTLGGGALTGGDTKNQAASGIWVKNGGNLIMNGGALKDCSTTVLQENGSGAGPSVQVDPGATFTMNAGEISNNKTTLVDPLGGVRVRGSFVMNGGSISDNTAVYAAGVTVGNTSVSGSFVMNGGTISGNNASNDFGGGVTVIQGSFTMNGGTISGNYAAGNGGGVAVVPALLNYGNLSAVFTMNGGTITGNRSGLSKENHSLGTSGGARTGGGVMVSGQAAKFIMNGGTISDNVAGTSISWGGGVMINTNAKAYLLGGTISGNTSPTEGGGVYMASAKVYLGAVTITGNTAGTQGGGVFCETPANLHLVGATIIGENMSGKFLNNLFLSASGKIVCHPTGTTIDGIAVPGFYNDIRMPQIGVRRASYGSSDMIFTSGLASVSCWPGRAFFADNSNYTVAHDYTSNPNTQEARFYPLGSGQQYVSMSWEVQIDGVSTWYPINDSALLNQLGVGATAKNDIATLSYTYGEHYVSGVKAYWNNGTTDVTVLDTTKNPMEILNYFDSFGNKKLTMSDPCNFTDTKNAGTYSFTANTSVLGSANRVTKNATLIIEVKKKDVNVYIKDKTVEYGLSSVEYLNQFNDPTKGYWQVDTATPLVTGDTLTGVKLIKDFGTDSGVYYVIPDPDAMDSLKAANPNYNITFVNRGKLTVDKRTVTMLLNDDYTNYADSTKKPQADTVDKVNENTFLNKTENTSTKYQNEKGEDQSDSQNNPLYKGGWQYAYDQTALNAAADQEAYKKEHQFLAADLAKVPFEYKFNYSSSNYHAADSDKWLNVGDYTVTVECTNNNYDVTFKNAKDNSKTTFVYSIRKADLAASLKEPSETAPKVPDYKSGTYTGTDQTIAVPDVALTIKGYQGLIDYTDESGKSTADWYKYIVHKNEDGVQTPAKPDADAADWASASSSVKKKEKGTYTVYVLVTVPNHKPVVYDYTYSLGANKIEYKIVLKQKPSATGAAAELSPEADKSVKTTYNGQTVTAEIVFAWDYDTNVQKPSTWDTDKPTLKLYYKSTDSYGYGSTDTAHPDESGTDANGQARNLGNSQATALAGSYVVTMLNESAETSNYDLVPASGYASSVNYKIEPKEIDVPTAPSAVTYDGTEKTFNVSLTYDSTVAVKIGKLNDSSQFVEGTLPDDLTENTVGGPQKTKSYKATKAGEYGVVFQLPFDSPDGKTARNYKWKNSTKAEATVTLTISAVELRVDWKFKEDNKPLANMSASYKANVKGEISTAYRTGYVPVTVDGTQEEPQLQFYYQYIKDAQGNAVADAPKVAITIIDLFKLENMKYDNAHVAGTYKIWVQLMSSEDYEQNGNYKFDEENDTYYSKEITITAGDADISGLGVQFTQNGTDYDFDKDSTKFTYSVDSDGNVLDFSFKLNFDAVDYLETDTSKYPNGIKYQKKDENGDWQDVAKVDGAGEYRVVYAIKVKDDKKDEHKLPANSDFSSDIFSDYKRDTTDTSKAEFTFPLTVGRAAVDLDGMKYEYKTAGGTWKTYDEKNLPEFTETNFEVRVKSPYPAGITAAEIEYDTETSTNGRKGPGKIGFTVNFELDDNYHYIDETDPDHPVLKQFEHKDTVEIAPKLIGAKWKPVTLTDEDGKAITDSIVGGSGVPYQISILDVAPEYKNYIVYEYVVKDSSGNEIDVFTDIMDYINQYQPTATNPLKVTVRVKIGGDAPTVGSGENKTYTYGLKDSTGKKVDSLEKSITLGAMLDLAEVSVNMDSTVYGTAVKHGDIFSVTSNGKPMNTALYSAVLCDADGKELGAIDTIDFASLNAGIYTVQLSVDEDAGYVLSLDKFTFTVEQKELEVPEIVGEIVFNGTIIDITSRLDSNYQDYLNRGIIKIEGTIDARNAGKTYSFTISITDSNYKWKNEEPPASTLAVQLADEDAGYTITVDEQDAVYDWHINPYVLKGTLWEFTKDGAVFKVPDWVKALTEGENPTLELIVKYYDSKDSEIALEEVALKGGATFFVSAVLAGEDVYNFIFEENGTVEDGTNSSPRVSYTVPQSGASAVLGKVKEFFTQYWQVVVCGVCLLLSIIFIALIAHYENNRKKAKKQTKQYMTYSAVGVGLFGLSLSMWSYIAYGAIGLTVLLLIGVIIAKVRSKKAKTLLQDTAKDYEENKDARAAKKAQEEEQRRREEERLQREEEKRLREEEKLLREEERRQREQDREEERRIREEEREEERRRREEEREEARIAAMEKQNNGNGNGGLGGLGLGLNGMFMGMGGLNPAMGMGMQQQPIQPAMSQQPAQQPIQQPVQTQPVQQAPQPPVQTVQTVQPVQTVVAAPVSQSASGFLLNDESLQQLRSDLREELRDELREEFEHQKRTEEFLEMIAESREKDRIKLEEEDRDLEERRRMLDLRRGDSQYGVISRPVEPMYPQTSMPHASYPFPYGANNGYGQYYDEQEFKIRALESKLQQMETWKYEMNRAADEKRLREIEDRQREILFREDERRMRAMEEMQRQMHYGYLPHNAPHRAEPPQPSVPPYQRPVEYVPQQPVSPQPNQSWQRQPNFTQKPYQKKQSYQSQAKQQPVVVVQQPNASTPPPAFHPGTIMTTTTTTTIDGTKSSEKENSDYEVKYSPFDRDGKYN